ncbi:hypothetical protein SAMN05421763_105317 [[Luteovulum] sphaeroides subsp. megalophilum]|nr:hypothetical protein SAMN05421763_105317 [[Luteovulum] sphaeroides subsp. megalophilum]
MIPGITILPGDCLASMRTLPDCSVHACVTSPPYFGLRSYLPDDHPDRLRSATQITVALWGNRTTASRSNQHERDRSSDHETR